MSFCRVFFYLLLALWPEFCFSQSYFFNHYDQTNGLLDLEINCITQDQFGYLWIGTSGGLFRFDGSNFEEIQYFNDPGSDPVYDLMIDNQGVIWIAGENGVTSYDGSNFNYFGLNGNDEDFKCYRLLEDDNKNVVFFYGEKSLYRIEHEKLVNISPLLGVIQDSIIDISGRTLNDLMLLTSRGDIWQYGKNGFYKTLPVDSPGGQICFSSNGKIYAVVSGKLILLDLQQNWHKTEVTTGIRDKMILDVFEANDSTQWISYNDEIVINYKFQTTVLKESKGFDGGIVTIIFCDAEHNIWLVTKNKGLYCYHGDVLRYLKYSENMNFMPTSICLNKDGQMMISYFGNGIEVYEDGGISKLDQGDGLASNYVRWITWQEDSCWIVTARGVTVMHNGIFHTYTTSDGLPHNYGFYACPDASGRIWIGTEGGVGIFENGSFSNITVGDGLLNNRIKFLKLQDDGSMLLLSDHGIDHVRNDTIERFVYEGLKNREVLNTMALDEKGNIWIGSDINGLIFYDLASHHVKYLNQYSEIPFSRVMAMTFYKNNWLCIGSEKGIYYLEVSQNGEIISLSSFGVEKGYPDFEVIQNAMIRIVNGIYVGTSIGVVKFNPDKILPDPDIPVHLTAINIEFKDTDWNKSKEPLNTWTGMPLHPALSYDQNDIKVDFKGISLKSKEKLWYRYQLLNHDQNWSEPIQNESVLYANLRPGKYNFRVTASYDRLYWTAAYTQYNFIIKPPFWMTWWFYVVVFSLLLVGFVLINNYRIKSRINQLLYVEKLNKEEYERIQKKVAMDFHDEVGNHLTSISLLIQLIKNRKWKLPAELQELLEKIDMESKNLFLGTNDFIWSIDPKNNNVKEVFYKIKDYGDEIFDNTGIKFQVRNGVGEDINLKLPAGFTRQILLIFKEAINNAKDHAGCNKVQFSVIMDPDSFTFKLSDDGFGFNTGELEYYRGLKKMKLRGEKIKGNLIFNSGAEEGTEIILKADLNKNIAS